MIAHAALLAWLIIALRTRADAVVASESVRLMVLTPRSVPKIRIDSVQPRRIEISPVLSNPPPLLAGVSSTASEPVSQSGTKDGATGVDWAAEARRALQAFEIRNRQPAGNRSVSRNSPAEQPWWPAHRPGERVKTADGNWIVWIDSSCYQVATSSPSASGSGPQPPTICPKRSGPPDTDPGDPAR
jgi:hypothetical protein